MYPYVIEAIWNSISYFCTKYYYNPGLNIFVLFKNFLQIRIPSSETTLDI